MPEDEEAETVAPDESVDDDAAGETVDAEPQESTTVGGTETEKPEKAADEVYCSSCGSTIKAEAEICPECGVRQSGVGSGEEKNPGLAAVASFFFAGLGQIYNGQIGKGLILILVQIINVGLMFILIGFLTYPVVWAYGIWDAYKTAEKINSGEIQV